MHLGRWETLPRPKGGDAQTFSESEVERIRGLSSTCAKYDELLELMELMGQMRELGGGGEGDDGFNAEL